MTDVHIHRTHTSYREIGGRACTLRTSRSPRRWCVMAEHSMCHPGRPSPQGEGQAMGSPSLAGFLWE